MVKGYASMLGRLYLPQNPMKSRGKFFVTNFRYLGLTVRNLGSRISQYEVLLLSLIMRPSLLDSMQH